VSPFIAVISQSGHDAVIPEQCGAVSGKVGGNTIEQEFYSTGYGGFFCSGFLRY
jgi:hypothetical protein